MPYRNKPYHHPGFERPVLTRSTTVRVRGAPGHPALARRMAGWTAREQHVQAWDVVGVDRSSPAGSCPDPEVRAATLALLNAVVRDDPDGVEQALADGAQVNVRLSPAAFGSRHAYPVMLRTPLGLAWWRQTHDRNGHPITGTTPAHERVPDLDVVAQLLDAGAEPQPRLLRRLRSEQWAGHPVVEALSLAVLDRIAGPAPLPPHTVLTAALRDRPTPPASVIPESTDHRAFSWLNQAVSFGHFAAVRRWFERGGVVGSSRTASVCPTLWDHHLWRGAQAYAAPFHEDWSSTLVAVEQALLREPETVYRQEVLGTMESIARMQSTVRLASSARKASHDALTWLTALLDQRPLTGFTLTDAEAETLVSTVRPGVEALLRTQEGRALSAPLGGLGLENDDARDGPATGLRPPRRRGRL